MDDDSILMVLPVPFFERDGELYFEEQAANGARLWAENFEKVTIAAPLSAAIGGRAMSIAPASDVGNIDRIRLVPLPDASGVQKFAAQYFSTRAKLSALVDQHRFLHFALWSLFGDWAAVGADIAHAKGRRFSVWTDIVNHSAYITGVSRSGVAAAKAQAVAWAMELYHHQIMRRAALGLFHGADCFNAYSPYCANSHLVHDIHLKKSDQISDTALQEKSASTVENRPLRIAYIGRVSEEKGPEDWVRTLAEAAKLGVGFEAEWYGDGPILGKIQALAGELGVADRIAFHGFISDRARIVAALRRADIFLFCHKTAESPRCLIEAMKSGAPIIGYGSDFPRDLAANGGGAFVEIGDIKGLAAVIANIDQDRRELSKLMASAAKSSENLDDESVFRHRSELIKEHS